MLKQYEFITTTNELDEELAFEIFKESSLYDANSIYVLFYIHDEWGQKYEICKIL